MSYATDRTPINKNKKENMPKDNKKQASPEVAQLVDLSSVEMSESQNELLSQTFRVRNSIDELEALSNASTSTKSPSKKAAAIIHKNPSKLKLTFSQQQAKTQTQNHIQTQVQIHNSPVEKDKTKAAATKTAQEKAINSVEPAKSKSRLEEAKTCVLKVKGHMYSNSAKNISTVIKNEVSAAIDRIFELLKESEGRAKGQIKEKGVQTILNTEGHETYKEPDQRTQEVQLQEEKILRKLEEHTKALEENTKIINELKESVCKQHETLEKASYARVVARNPDTPMPQKPLHSIVIASSDETDSGDQVMEQTRSAVNARDGGIQVQTIRKARNHKIIMGFSSAEERTRVKERIERSGKKLVVEEVKNKDPLLVLRNVFSVHTDEEVVEFLRSQNRSVFYGLDKEENRVEVKYRKRARNPHQSHIVVKVSPTIWNRALAAGTVSIDIQPVRVEDQSPLVQCSLCLGYGHARKHCIETTVKCSHCGGDHVRADCPGWISRDIPECCNCAKAQLVNRQHNAFSSECTVRRKWEQMARSTVAYC